MGLQHALVNEFLDVKSSGKVHQKHSVQCVFNFLAQIRKSSCLLKQFWSDVTPEKGPFEYIPQKQTPGYHQFRQVNNIVRDRDMAQVVPKAQWRQCLGARGTVVIANTASLFHHASLPQQDRHSITFAYVSTAPKNLAKCRQWCPYDGTDAWLKIQSQLSSRQWQALMSWR